MTCIVGLVHKGRVYIGGDSAGVGGMHLEVRKDAKVFKNDGFVFGFTSSFRMGQLIRYSFKPPMRDESKDLSAYMVTDFVDAIRACLKAGGFAEKDKEKETGGTFLVGHAGHLFCIQDDYQVAERAHPYDACGCGQDIALGALFATPNMDPKKRALLSLKAAEANSAGVRGPFHIESI